MPDFIKIMVFAFVSFVVGHTANEKLSNEQIASVSLDSLRNIYRLQLVKEKELNKLPDSVISFDNKIRNPFYISKSDSNDNLIWIINVGGSPFELPNKILNDPENNLYLMGSVGNQFAFNQSNGTGIDQTTKHTSFIVKYNDKGMEEWACFIPGLDLYRYFEINFKNGQIVIAGFFNGFFIQKAIWPNQYIYWRQ